MISDEAKHKNDLPIQNKLKVIGYDDKEQSFIVASSAGNTLKVADTFAEMFTMMEISPAPPSFSVRCRGIGSLL